MQKIEFDCISGNMKVVPFTIEEMTQCETESKAYEEQKLLDGLIPSEKEILMAEIEIQTIEILTEGGLL